MDKFASIFRWLFRSGARQVIFGSGAVFLLLLVETLSACSFPNVNQTASTSYQFTFAPSQQAKVILVCDDRTGSVKGTIYNAGLRLATRNLAGIIHEGQGSITFTFAKIDHRSHLPEST